MHFIFINSEKIILSISLLNFALQQIFQAKLYIFTEVVPCPGFGGEVQSQLRSSLLWELGQVPLDSFLSCRLQIIICCFCSAAQSCSTLCDRMDCSMPGFPVLHYLPKFAQTHAHWVDNAIQPSRPLLPPSPPAFNLSQHQGLFQWLGSSHQLAKVLELQL